MQNKKIFTFFAFILPLIALILVQYLFFSGTIDFQSYKSFSLGILIAFLNFIIGFFTMKIGINKPNKSFLIIVFGGVVVRFFLIFILIILTLSFLYVRMNSFIFTTFTFYFYFLIVEVLYLKNQKILIKNE